MRACPRSTRRPPGQSPGLLRARPPKTTATGRAAGPAARDGRQGGGGQAQTGPGHSGQGHEVQKARQPARIRAGAPAWWWGRHGDGVQTLGQAAFCQGPASSGGRSGTTTRHPGGGAFGREIGQARCRWIVKDMITPAARRRSGSGGRATPAGVAPAQAPDWSSGSPGRRPWGREEDAEFQEIAPDRPRARPSSRRAPDRVAAGE